MTKVKQTKRKMKPRVWLAPECPPGKWVYGLGRLEDGAIVVAECFGSLGGGFGVVGRGGVDDDEPHNLLPGERKKIIRDLLIACKEALNE